MPVSFPVLPGGSVTAEEYNTVTASVNKIFADKYPSAAVTDPSRKDTHKFGWGSSSLDDTIPTEVLITADRLQYLVDRTNVMIDHCDITDTIIVFAVPASRTAVLANTPIRAEDLNLIWEKIENTILPDAVRTSIDATNASALSSGVTLSRSTPWQFQLIGEWKWTFDDYNHARYFFNGGGQLRIAGEVSGGSTTGYYNWQELVNEMGVLSFIWDNVTQSDSATPGTTANKGIYDLTEYYGDGSDAGTADEGLLFTSALYSADNENPYSGYANISFKLYGKYADNGREIIFKALLDDQVLANSVDGTITFTPSFLMPDAITRNSATFDVLPLPTCTVIDDFTTGNDN